MRTENTEYKDERTPGEWFPNEEMVATRLDEGRIEVVATQPLSGRANSARARRNAVLLAAAPHLLAALKALVIASDAVLFGLPPQDEETPEQSADRETWAIALSAARDALADAGAPEPGYPATKTATDDERES